MAFCHAYGIFNARDEVDRASAEARPSVGMDTLACLADGSFINRDVRRHGLFSPFVAFRMGAAGTSHLGHRFSDCVNLDALLFFLRIRFLVFHYCFCQMAWGREPNAFIEIAGRTTKRERMTHGKRAGS